MNDLLAHVDLSFKLKCKDVILIWRCDIPWLDLCTVVATTNKNSNASLVYSFLYKLVEVSDT